LSGDVATVTMSVGTADALSFCSLRNDWKPGKTNYLCANLLILIPNCFTTYIVCICLSQDEYFDFIEVLAETFQNQLSFSSFLMSIDQTVKVIKAIDSHNNLRKDKSTREINFGFNFS
jgi:hypothetical protein